MQALKKQGFSNCAIAWNINCSSLTVGYELDDGMSAYSVYGHKLGYLSQTGVTVYKANLSCCHRPKTVPRDSVFIRWMVKKLCGSSLVIWCVYGMGTPNLYIHSVLLHRGASCAEQALVHPIGYVPHTWMYSSCRNCLRTDNFSMS